MNTIRPLVLCLLATGLLAGCDRPDAPSEPLQPIASASETSRPTPLPPTGAAANGARPADTATSSPVRVVMSSASGSNVSGELALSPSSAGVRLSGRISGLTAGGEHGFHVHEVGDCSAPDASSAGPHFNPDALPHGHPDPDRHHAGDLPNLRADPNGDLAVDIVANGLELGSGGARDVQGRAVVLHAKADDFTSQPAGDSGERIACGVIGTTPRA